MISKREVFVISMTDSVIYGESRLVTNEVKAMTHC